MDTTIYLIAETTTKNTYGAPITQEVKREVYCEERSVSRAEYYNGQQAGLDMSYVFVTNQVNYNGEKLLEYNSERYSIVRTYKTDADMMEIYAGMKVGVARGSD